MSTRTLEMSLATPGVDAAGYLQKPFELDDLLSAVRRHARAA